MILANGLFCVINVLTLIIRKTFRIDLWIEQTLRTLFKF